MRVNKKSKPSQSYPEASKSSKFISREKSRSNKTATIPKTQKTERKTRIRNVQDEFTLRVTTLLRRNTSRALEHLSTVPYLQGTAVHIADSSWKWWPAVVKDVQGPRLLIGYDGWDENYDEWILEDSRRLRLAKDYEGEILEIADQASTAVFSKGVVLNDEQRSRIRPKNLRFVCHHNTD